MSKKVLSVSQLASRFSIPPDGAMQLIDAVNAGTSIIIDGKRNTPTGKSALCAYLRDCGIDAKEVWDLEENEKPDMTANRVCCYVWLGKELN